MRAMNVKKALMSVFDMVETGHRVVFDKEDGQDVSHAFNKTTGEKTKFILRNNVWELDVDVIPFKDLTKNPELKKFATSVCSLDGVRNAAIRKKPAREPITGPMFFKRLDLP